MGYTFKIGNATPRHNKDDFPNLHAEWDVDLIANDEAPTFPNDEMTGNGNHRSPSYSVWSNFCKEVGIYDVFFYETGHLVGAHPGCVGIDQEMFDRIKAAREAREEKSTLPPGFEDWDYDGPARFDYYLARLIWLEWWMDWAMKNCETPAIANY